MYFKYEHLHNATSEPLPNSIAGRFGQSERSVVDRNQVLLEVGRGSHARTSSGVFAFSTATDGPLTGRELNGKTF